MKRSLLGGPLGPALLLRRPSLDPSDEPLAWCWRPVLVLGIGLAPLWR